ncbi:KH domain-containing protein [Cryptococcus neoformans A2-102-5]|nr:KH domain-containing protein [Cryptococcus neoformans var. grubii D17-1]OXG92817.1 KH domain-containing protein [Cryptococcus neoformans var. grubii A2-102-5]
MDTERRSRWADVPSTSSPAPPAGSSAANDTASDAAARAAAIAAKIAASLRPGVQGTELVKKEKEEGDFVKDIEINDLRNRYVLTKGSTQKQIEEETGASITTKGVWVPDRSKMPPGEVPLYLHVVATSQSILDAAIGKINDLINQELGPLIDERTLVARNRALGLPPPSGAMPNGRVKWPEQRLYIGLESLRNFNVRAKTVGPGGMFVKYIQAETGARVQIKGQGSGFMESDTGRESDEPMHINIAAPTEDQVERAKVLAEDLLEVLRGEHAKARDAHNQGAQGGAYGGYAAYGGQTAGQDPYAAYYAQTGATATGTPGSQPGATPAAGGATPAQGSDAWAQYAAYWAAYGYDVNDPQFQAWQAQQYGQQAGQSADAAAAGASATPQAGSATPAVAP